MEFFYATYKFLEDFMGFCSHIVIAGIVWIIFHIIFIDILIKKISLPVTNWINPFLSDNEKLRVSAMFSSFLIFFIFFIIFLDEGVAILAALTTYFISYILMHWDWDNHIFYLILAFKIYIFLYIFLYLLNLF